ncbi:hypothetical protein HK100_003589 [Physocladia obscura]|uniref:Uncharacterized protein n=1 Tax=Physocladia obscura TaxID=109957 RepID=A0AAD5SU62_9FUNG|nr:hypothetical protein HK100_003589 [Physocladia obscura]
MIEAEHFSQQAAENEVIIVLNEEVESEVKAENPEEKEAMESDSGGSGLRSRSESEPVAAALVAEWRALLHLSPVELMLGGTVETSNTNAIVAATTTISNVNTNTYTNTMRLSVASVDSSFALRLPSNSNLLRHSANDLNRLSVPHSQSYSRSESHTRSHRLSVASLSASFGAAVASIHEHFQASTTAGYSNNWAFGIFESWWAVEPASFAFISKAPTIFTQPQRAPIMSTGISPTNSPAANSTPSPETTPSRPVEHSEIFIKRNSKISVHPESQPQMLQVLINKPQNVFPPSNSARVGISSTPLRQALTQSSNYHKQTSILPILSSIFCPCLVYGQSREMFLRSGGVLEGDVIDILCCGPPRVNSGESARICSASCGFATLMPCCLCYIPHRALRSAIRVRYALREDDEEAGGGFSRRVCCGMECGEFMVACFCMPCALVQERREIVHWEKVVDGARSRRGGNF